MPQFETGSAKLSISSIIAPQQTRVTIADDINNLIETTSKGVSIYDEQQKKAKEAADLEQFQQHSLLYNEAKRQYIDKNRNAITADEKKAVFTEYAGVLDSIAKSPKLSDKHRVQLQESANKDLYYASAEYEGVLDAETKGKFKGAMAEIITATAALPIEERYKQYQDILELAPANRMTKVEASEAFSKILLDEVRTQLLAPGTSYQQAQLKEQELLEFLGKDVFNQGKSYINEAKQEMFAIKNSIATNNKFELTQNLASERIGVEAKKGLVNAAVEQGWLNPLMGKAMIEGVLSDAVVKQREGQRSLQHALLTDYTISEEKAKEIAFMPGTGRDKNASEALFQAWKANNANLNRQITIASMDNVVASDTIEPTQKINIIKSALDTESNPLLRAKLEGSLVKAQNELRDDTVKYHENIIKNKKGSFEEGLASAMFLQEKGMYDVAKTEKVVGDLLVREEARIKAVEKENQAIEEKLLKGETKVFKANMRNKDLSDSAKNTIIDNAEFLTKEEKDMYKSLVSAGKQSELEALIKGNLKLDRDLATDRKTILKAVVKNSEYPISYKIKKINENLDLSTEEKKTMISTLKDASYKQQMKEYKAQTEEEQRAYRNIAKQYSVGAAQGQWDINTDQWRNAIAIGWANKDIDKEVWGQYQLYTKQKELYNAITTNNPITNMGDFANVYIKNVPEIDNKINMLRNVDKLTPDTLTSTLAYIKKAEANHYVIPKDLSDLARVAEQFTAYNPTEGTERFRTYLTSKSTGVTEAQRSGYYKKILGMTGLNANLIGNSAINDVINTVAASSMTDKMAEEYLKQTIDEEFIKIDRWTGSDYLIKKGRGYMATEKDFEAAISILSRDKDVGYKVKAVIPVDSTDPDNTDWIAIPEDSTKLGKVIPNKTMRLLGGK